MSEGRRARLAAPLAIEDDRGERGKGRRLHFRERDPQAGHCQGSRDPANSGLCAGTTPKVAGSSRRSGGAAGGIWGVNWGGGEPYPDRHQNLTHARFWRDRLGRDFESEYLGEGTFASVDRRGSAAVVYREDASWVPIDLRGVEGPPLAVSVDTKRPYQELPIGVLEPGEHRWEAPMNRTGWWPYGSFGLGSLRVRQARCGSARRTMDLARLTGLARE